MQHPRDTHWAALIHTMNYLYSTCGQGILIQGNTQLTLQAYSDSDWGAFQDSRRSVTRYILMLGQSPISWKLKKQSVVSSSVLRPNIVPWPMLHSKSAG